MFDTPVSPVLPDQCTALRDWTSRGIRVYRPGMAETIQQWPNEFGMARARYLLVDVKSC
jgi:hypothetical protein